MQARARLRQWLKDNDKTQADLARSISVSRQAVHHYISGYARPGRAAARRIEVTCGIEIDAWLTAEEKKLAS